MTGDGGPGDLVQAELRSTERLKALSDGVFAIVLTILVLELKVPPHLAHKSLLEALRELRPTLIARVRTVNRDLVWLNLLFLLPCALIPFASSVMGEYPADPRSIQIYGVVVIVGSLMRLALYAYVMRHPVLLWPGVQGDSVGLGYLLILLPVVVYLVAMGVAQVSPTAAAVVFLTVPGIYFLAVTIARDNSRPTSEVEEFS